MIKVGERLGRFELLRELGRGSHGVVFEANDTLLNEKVAIKALQPWLSGDPTLRERFKRELILTRRVAHPGVCRLFDLHDDGDAFFISMQLVEGRSLSVLLREEAPAMPRVIKLLRGICGALTAAHAQGVVHRDLKPANVMVDGKDNVVVLDFGIATATGVGQLTRPGQALGSVPFIPPEVWEGEPASPSGDQYALGVIGFAAGTGTLPYRGQNPLEIVDAIRAGQPTLRERFADIDPAYEAVILQAMARKPADRFVDVAALDEALAGLQAPTSPGLQLGPRTTSLSSLRSVGSTDLPAPVTMPSSTPLPATPEPPEPPALSVSQLDELAPTPRRFDEMEPLTMESGIVSLPSRESMPVTAPTAESTVEVDTEPFSNDLKTDIGPRLEREREPTLIVRMPELSLPNTLNDAVAPPPQRPVAVYAAIAVAAVAVVALAGVAVSSSFANSGAVADAGVAVAVVDAGAVAADAVAADAGVAAAAVDAGNVDLALAELPELPELAEVEGEARRTRRPPDPVLLVQIDAKNRGVRPGDVPAYDDAMGRAKKATGAAREKGAGEAKKILSAVVVDKAFVGRKLALFNAAFDKAPITTQNKVKPLSKDVLQRFSKGDWKGANARLNEAFTALQKK